MHHCLAKSKLIGLMKEIPSNNTTDSSCVTSIPPDDTPRQPHAPTKVAIVDGIAELHCMGKQVHLYTCQDLAAYFCKWMNGKFCSYDEVHLVFDSYIMGSLKTATREFRQQNSEPVEYKIVPTTIISKVTMTNLLAHDKIKDSVMI